MKIDTEIGYVKKSEIVPRERDICGICRYKGQDICARDEICHMRLAVALGKEVRDVTASLDYAAKRGLITLREESTKKGKVRFVKITDQGKLFSGRRK
jgi:hypothetical protein